MGLVCSQTALHKLKTHKIKCPFSNCKQWRCFIPAYLWDSYRSNMLYKYKFVQSAINTYMYRRVCVYKDTEHAWYKLTIFFPWPKNVSMTRNKLCLKNTYTPDIAQCWRQKKMSLQIMLISYITENLQQTLTYTECLKWVFVVKNNNKQTWTISQNSTSSTSIAPSTSIQS